MSDQPKCFKCKSTTVELFQRGMYISGVRCLSCQYQTLSRVCRTVDEMRAFIESMPGEAQMLFQDDIAYPKLEAHFEGDISRAHRLKMWRGASKE